MTDDTYIEVNCQQRNHTGERICGDIYLTHRIEEENRTIAVLSDGMGHGVKANVLATLTATMALKFTKEHESVEKIAEVILKTLPECSERKMSYATFTIIDIHHGQQMNILEYGNPETMVFRDGQPLMPQWNCIILTQGKGRGKEIRSCSFVPRKEDRVVVFTDGITQSGLGAGKYPMGWGLSGVGDHIRQLLRRDPSMSARKLAARLVNVAVQNDNFQPKDDASCMVFYFREPRKLLVCTGPPFDETKDAMIAQMLDGFAGRKIICGATTAEIIARELNRDISDHQQRFDDELPPTATMEGVDLITEGLLTLSRVSSLLETHQEEDRIGKGPADQILKHLLQSDEILFLVGTRINTAHQDPTFPVELEIRRTLIRRISKTLQRKYLKRVDCQYL